MQKRHKGREERQTFLWHLSHSGGALLWAEKVPDEGKETRQKTEGGSFV